MAVNPQIKTFTLRPSKAPNQPIAPVDYDQRYQDGYNNALRLYFNEIDNITQALASNTGTAALKFPNGAWYDVGATQTAAAINTPYAVRFDSTTVENGIFLSDYVTTFVGSIATTTLTVTSTTGVIEPGMTLTGGSVTAGTTIVKQLTGTAGSTGTYQVSASQTRASATLTGTYANTVISCTVPGYFNIQFSLQLSKSSGGAAYAWIWPRVNGLNIDDSNTKVAIQGTTAELVAAWNFVLPLNAGDQFQLMWATDDGVTLLKEPANAFSPAIPSAILSATFVSALY